MKMIIILAVLGLMASPVSATDGHFLQDACANTDKQRVKDGFCMGYILGAAGVLRVTMRSKCTNKAGLSNAKIINAVRKYLADNPQNHNKDAAEIVYIAMDEDIPCFPL